MTIVQTIQNDIILALKNGQAPKVSTLRLLSAAIKNEQIARQSPLDDPQIISVIQKLIKQRQEAMEIYAKAGRVAQAAQEEAELNILHQYLPKQLTPDELESVVKSVIDEVNARTKQDAGRVIKEVMTRVKGQAAGKMVSDLVTKFLSQ